MSTLRLYAAPLVLIVWAAMIEIVGNSSALIVIRLVVLAGAVAVTVHESVRVNGQRKHRRGR